MKLIILIWTLFLSVGVNAQFLATSMSSGKEPSSLLTGLVAYFRFEEASGTVYSEVGEYSAVVGTAPDYHVTGKQGYCVDFDASNSEYFTMASFWNPGTGDWTIAAWIYLEVGTSAGGILGCLGTDPDWYFRAQNNNVWKGFVDFGPASYEATTGTQPSTGAWHLFLVEYDRSAYETCWLDNVEKTANRVDISTYSATNVTNANTFYIGNVGGPTAGYYLDGLLDELMVWSRILTPTEKAALYNSGNGIPWPLDY